MIPQVGPNNSILGVLLRVYDPQRNMPSPSFCHRKRFRRDQGEIIFPYLEEKEERVAVWAGGIFVLLGPNRAVVFTSRDSPMSA